MKAFVYRKYGSPDVLELVDLPKPVPTENQVLVKIFAASANPLDWHQMRADPFIVRFGNGFFAPKTVMGIGADFAGIIEAVGSAVTDFQVGDEVFGSVWAGAFAEYVAVSTKTLVKKAPNISFEDAASAPVVGLTALQGLRDKGQIQAGEKVLINGASGGVGSFALQLAKSYGAEVTGVASRRNVELLRSIGADKVIAYDEEDFTKTGEKYDLIYCAVGNRSVWDYKRALKPHGRCVIAGFTSLLRVVEHIFIANQVSKNSPQKVGMMGTAQTKAEDLQFINDLLAAGKVKAVIDRCYPFAEAPEAIRYLETGRARGKVIVSPIQVR